jgi:hypothetical protein
VRRPLRIIAILFSVVLAIPVLGIIGYDLRCYESNRSEISRVITSATADERHLPMPLAKFLQEEFRNGTDAYAARLLIYHLGIGGTHMSAGHWAITYALWCELVRYHLSAAERMTVIAALAPTGPNRRGLSDSSLALFQKPLSALEPRECATLVALIQAPSLASNPETLALRTGYVLRKYENGT